MSANPNIVWIDPDVCEKCNICVEVFGCPAIQLGTGGLVPWIHGELCNGNGSCIQVCPVGAIKRMPQGRFAETGDTTAGGNPPPGYAGGPLSGSKTDFGGKDSEVCK